MTINDYFGSPFGDVKQIGGLVSLFLNVAFVFAGLIFLFGFVMSGIKMISSAGKNDPQKSEQAKKALTSAVIGFVVVFAAYWIVKLLGTFTGLTDILGLN